MLLNLRSIARFYGSRLIFRNVSMVVEEGTVTLLAGANGAGKSTLLKIMAGLVRPSSGEVVLQEKDGAPATLGFLGHQTFIYPELTAVENLRFWSAMYDLRLNDAALMAVLQKVELAAFAEEKAKNFSRGMAQRLNLARVFLQKPDVLLLDEPATGLDTRSTSILHHEILEAKERGTAVVWITHSLQEDLQYADSVALLQSKKLGFYGPAAEYREYISSSAPLTTKESGKCGGSEC